MLIIAFRTLSTFELRHHILQRLAFLSIHHIFVVRKILVKSILAVTVHLVCRALLSTLRLRLFLEHQAARNH